ncbi:hypothetical protein ABIC09_001714 [Bradyrhizobium sp. S3.12.5]|uniref:hypothetical protein n=1 Tax=Bradyrhizobium sp. S3.12.5 TaxID=3156386 RepID=UPI0033926D38
MPTISASVDRSRIGGHASRLGKNLAVTLRFRPATGELQNLFHRLIRVRGGRNKARVIRPVAYHEFIDDVLYPRRAFSSDCDKSDVVAKALLDEGIQ